MPEEVLSDLQITGSRQVPGGRYGTVMITEEGQIEGGLSCDVLICSGHSNVCKIAGNVNTSELKTHGVINVTGNLRGDLMKTWGAVTVDGECEAELFTLSGGMDLKGLLSADTIDIKMFWPCRAKEIGGEHIRIKRLPDWMNRLKNLFQYFKSPDPPTFQCDLIEGDDISLEHTQARVVRGGRVAIGAGCEIETVEYSDSFHQHREAKVKHQVKLA